MEKWRKNPVLRGDNKRCLHKSVYLYIFCGSGCSFWNIKIKNTDELLCPQGYLDLGLTLLSESECCDSNPICFFVKFSAHLLTICWLSVYMCAAKERNPVFVHSAGFVNGRQTKRLWPIHTTLFQCVQCTFMLVSYFFVMHRTEGGSGSELDGKSGIICELCKYAN